MQACRPLPPPLLSLVCALFYGGGSIASGQTATAASPDTGVRPDHRYTTGYTLLLQATHYSCHWCVPSSVEVPALQACRSCHPCHWCVPFLLSWLPVRGKRATCRHFHCSTPVTGVCDRCQWLPPTAAMDMARCCFALCLPWLLVVASCRFLEQPDQLCVHAPTCKHPCSMS